MAHDQNGTRANGMLVGRVINLFVLVLSPDWFVLVLLYYISHWVPGQNKTEASVPIEVSGVEPDLDGLLY
jgi:hypothetical protein